MCLIALAWQANADIPLLVAANRDEFYHRPTRMLQEWPEHPGVYAGRDLREGGTWLGMSRKGRFAAVTNYREAGGLDRHPNSRGKLPLAFLQGELDPAEYLHGISSVADQYGGFNLLVGDPTSLWYFTNRGTDQQPQCLGAGIYGLSNGALDSPWPKLLRCKEGLRTSLDHGASHQSLIDLLHDRWQAPDTELPDTGVGLRFERMLAPAFIHSAVYGTRASTALSMRANGEVRITEQNYWRFGMRWRRRSVQFTIEP